MRRRQFRTRFFFHFSLFLTGGFLYGLTEVLFRGYTHWSMFLLGGVCMLGVGLVRRRLRGPLVGKMLVSGLFITLAEFLCGLCVNRMLGMCVWDYSDVPYNMLGQICFPFSAAWCVLSLPAMGVDLLHCHCIWKTGKTKAVTPVPTTSAALADGKLRGAADIPDLWILSDAPVFVTPRSR